MGFSKRVVYAHDGSCWYRTEYLKQCGCSVGLSKRPCQGAKDHSGPHWCYSEGGDYEWHENVAEVDLKDDLRVVCGTVPPGHKDYVPPIDKRGDYFLGKVDRVDAVDDPTAIAKLEQLRSPEVGATVYGRIKVA